MVDYSVPARIVITIDEKHHAIDSQRRASVSRPRSYRRAQRRNTMASGGPERASYVSSRGAAYHRCNEKFFYGRDSSEPLLKSDLDSDVSSTKSAKSDTSMTCGTVVVMY